MTQKHTGKHVEKKLHAGMSAEEIIRHSVPVRKGKRINQEAIIAILLLVFLATALFNQTQIYSLSKAVSQKVIEAEEASRPAKIQLAVITDKNCPDCFPIHAAAAAVKATNVNITGEKELDYGTAEAKELIKRYGIETIPAIIITGEINKTPQSGFVEQNNALVFQKPEPPFIDLHQNMVVGRVRLTIINATSCAKCTDLGPTAAQIKAAGVSIYRQSVVDSDSAEGKALIEKYNITKLPAMLLSADAAYYSVIASAWATVGTVESDGTHIMKQISPPFYDVASKEVKGLATIILLNDSSCTECYDVTQHTPILKRGFGIVTETEKTVDLASSEGKALAEKYRITAVPTVIMTGVDAYESLKQPWQSVGTVESDGAYVFRKFENWPGNAYKDLATGKVV
ncbi:hypothetical protein HYV82_00070, partial [Candidatus Woesearchaeota archaeon]|nr:hypothetical protein [Candidatus Woesearchaeota archaeon]